MSSFKQAFCLMKACKEVFPQKFRLRQCSPQITSNYTFIHHIKRKLSREPVSIKDLASQKNIQKILLKLQDSDANHVW